MIRDVVENCYQCANYQVCFLRKGVDDLLDMGHHKEIVGSKAILANSIPLPFLELLASICQVKEKGVEK